MINTVIISYYDSAVYCEIMVKGVKLERNSDEFRDILHMYNKYYTGEFMDYIFRKYGCDLLVCENGSIEFYPFNDCGLK